MAVGTCDGPRPCGLPGRAARMRAGLVASGLILGLAVLARQDLGAYGLIAVIASSRSLRPLAGAAIILVPAAVALLLLVPASALFDQLVWDPLVGTREFRGLPGPALTAVLDPAATMDSSFTGHQSQ